jgi:2-oxoglutarate dehydrogenase E2 component (dihydrolipoamide succinyltransferase)
MEPPNQEFKMRIELLVPNLPESVADATIINWHKKVGEAVVKDENLVDLETDKVVLEVPAPESGVLTEIAKGDGITVVSGELLGLFEAQAEISPEQPDVPAAQAKTESSLSPAVRRLILEHELDANEITGTGKHDNLTKADVLAFIKTRSEQLKKKASENIQITSKTPVKPAPKLSAHKAGNGVGIRPEQRVPMTRLRAKIAERLLEAQQNTAMLTTFNEVNMQTVIDLRNQYKARFEQQHDIKLGFMSFFVKASIEALKRFPIVNASIDNKDIIYHGYYDIGIAVSTERGLIVPIIRDADQLDFAGIEKNIADFGGKARTGSLTLNDLSGGTFTLTNGGIFGSMLSTPLLNPPQSAILGMHSIKERPVVEDGAVVIRPIMYLALSYDHRLIDGREAVQFLGTIKECLEAPAHLLLNI